MHPLQGNNGLTPYHQGNSVPSQGQNSSGVQHPQSQGPLTGAGYARSLGYGSAPSAGHWQASHQAPPQRPYGHAVQIRPNPAPQRSLHSTHYAVSQHSELAHALDPSRIRYRNPAERARRTKAVETITKTLRTRIGQSVQSTMLSRGGDWKIEGGDTPPLSIQEMSAQNISALRSTLSEPPLAPHEKWFMKMMLETPMFITHATDAKVMDHQGNVTLYSRDKLQKQGIAFAEDHSDDSDIYGLGNSDHVFFSLEVGDRPQKRASRFGSTLMRFPFEQDAVTQTGMMFLIDPLQDELPSVDGHFRTLERLPPASKKAVIDTYDAREFELSDYVYHGKDMKVGLIMSIIEDSRNLPPDVALALLTKEKPNDLINHTFRPQVMIPRHFFGKPHDVTRIARIEMS